MAVTLKVFKEVWLGFMDARFQFYAAQGRVVLVLFSFLRRLDMIKKTKIHFNLFQTFSRLPDSLKNKQTTTRNPTNVMC